MATAGMYVSVLFYEGFHVFAVATGFASRFHVSCKGYGPHISVGHSTSGWELTVFERCIRTPKRVMFIVAMPTVVLCVRVLTGPWMYFVTLTFIHSTYPRVPAL